MLNKKSFVSQKGMTLVELLAAITILGIVFIGLLSIFPQMTNSNKQTEEKLETMNLAKIELAQLKDEPEIINSKNAEVIVVNENINSYRYVLGDYDYEVDYYKTPDLDKNEHEESVKLNKIHIKVNKNDNLISETFGYIKNSDFD